MPDFLPNPARFDLDGWATTLKTTPTTARGLRGAYAAPTRSACVLYVFIRMHIHMYIYIYIYTSIYRYHTIHHQPTRTYAPILHRLAYADPTQTYCPAGTCYVADFQRPRLYVALRVEKQGCSGFGARRQMATTPAVSKRIFSPSAPRFGSALGFKEVYLKKPKPALLRLSLL